MKQTRPGWVEAWFKTLVERSAFRVESIPLSTSTEWSLSEGAICHKSGHFFNIVGLQWTDPSGQTIAQPLIEQREIGMLGFLMRQGEAGNELLVHAKIEPGNVGIVQMAPTCQATYSNSSLFHGGEPPPYSDLFLTRKLDVIHESLQSEQGTRFLDKRNCNMLAVARQLVLERDTHRWMPADEFLELLSIDYLVNTDARSVLICSSWHDLVGRKPFSRFRSPFSIDLEKSACCDGRLTSTSDLKRHMQTMRSRVAVERVIPLEQLEGWSLTDEGLRPREGGPFIVRQIKVIAHGREVSSWDQPIIDSKGEGRVDLVCGRIDGLLHFMFRPQVEAGLSNDVELGPTVTIGPGEKIDENQLQDWSGAELISATHLSDEGGRFFLDRSLYRVLDAGQVDGKAAGGCWLSLKQVRQLLDEGGWFTNEARSALAQLLVWL